MFVKSTSQKSILKPLLSGFVLSTLLVVQGCSSLISGATSNLAQQLQDTISNHNDPQLVKDAVPAYMLMVESFVRGDPKNIDMLVAASGLYTAYTSVFVDDADRQRKLAQRGFDYAQTAMCELNQEYCDLKAQQYEVFLTKIAQMQKQEVPVISAYGAAWGTWLKANSSDFNAIADLPKVTRLMEKLVELDEFYQSGNGHLYLGIIHTLTPPAVGGKPDVAKMHFERAIEISGGKNLMVKVTYAQQYARMLFDRELHDKLLNEVLAADPNVPDFTLTNSMAIDVAKALLEDADEYF